MKRLPIHFLLFSLFPVLFLYDHNKDLLYFSYAIRSLALALLLGLVSFLIFFFFFRNIKKSAAVTSLFILLFFLFGHLYGYIYTFAINTNINIADYYLFINLCYGTLFVLLGIVLVLGIFLITRTKKSLGALTLFLNTTALLLLIYTSFSIAIYSLYETKKDQATTIHSQLSNANLPDIYHIILDGYGRQDTLEVYYDFDNESFISNLQEIGFFVASNSHSNYAQTYPSLSSVLNQEYIDIEQLELSDTSTDDRGPYKLYPGRAEKKRL